MWMGRWSKELDKLYGRYIDIFDIEPDCDMDADLDDVSYNAFKSAIMKSLLTQRPISLQLKSP